MDKFQKYVHPRLTKKQVKAKEWLSPKSETFEALQNIVLGKKVLEYLSYLTKFCHTGVLQIYHSLYNKCAPKRQHFSYPGMLARSQLAIMDFNEGSNLNQATTEIFQNYQKLVFETNQKRKRQKLFALYGKRNHSVCLPKNMASIPKPDKAAVIKNQRSCFGN